MKKFLTICIILFSHWQICSASNFKPEDFSNLERCCAVDFEIVVYAESRLIKPGVTQYDTRYIVDRPKSQHIYHAITITSEKEPNVINKFNEPARMRDQIVISNDTTHWIYFYKIDRVLELPKKESLIGGAFSYRDIFNYSITKYYEIIDKEVDDKNNAIIFHMKAISKDAVYDKVIYTISFPDHYPLSKKFITKDGIELKQLHYTNHDQYGSPMKWTFKSLVDKEIVGTLFIDSYKERNDLADISFSLESIKENLASIYN